MVQAWWNISHGGFDLKNTIDQFGVIDVYETVLQTMGEHVLL